MTWNIESREDTSAVRVICSGSLSADDLTMLAIEASFLVREHRHAKVLIDLSDASLGFPPSDLCALLDIYAEHHLPSNFKTGIVLAAADASRDLSRLLAAAGDSGYQLDILQIGQADGWLSQAD